MTQTGHLAGTALLSYQVDGMDWVLRTPKGLLADEAGLGKTPQALAAVQHILDNCEPTSRPTRPNAPRICRALWITDASLLDQTKTEAHRFSPALTVLNGNDPELSTGMRAQLRMRERYPAGVDLLILSYDTVLSRRQWLSHFSPSMLVLDEVSNIKGRGKQFEAVRDLSSRTPRVLAMTATPIENDPTELWTVLRATDAPDLWSANAYDSKFVTFRVGYVDKWGKQRLVPDGWKEDALPELRDYLAQIVLRRTHEQVGSQRPVRVHTDVIEVELTPEQDAAYKAAQKAPTRDAVRRMETAALVSGPKPPAVEALVQQLDQRGEPAIVYCETLEMLDLVEARLQEHQVSTCRIEGKVSAADRRDAIERHRSGDSHVLLASRVLEYGLNLQHCRLLISLDTSWNPARERQREGRICRLGSPHDTYEHLVIRPKTKLAQAKADKLERKLRCAELVGLG